VHAGIMVCKITDPREAKINSAKENYEYNELHLAFSREAIVDPGKSFDVE
jgi:hypothetical protein